MNPEFWTTRHEGETPAQWLKRRALEATLDRLAHEYRFAPLRDVAAEVQREGLASARAG